MKLQLIEEDVKYPELEVSNVQKLLEEHKVTFQFAFDEKTSLPKSFAKWIEYFYKPEEKSVKQWDCFLEDEKEQWYLTKVSPFSICFPDTDYSTCLVEVVLKYEEIKYALIDPFTGFVHWKRYWRSAGNL